MLNSVDQRFTFHTTEITLFWVVSLQRILLSTRRYLTFNNDFSADQEPASSSAHVAAALFQSYRTSIIYNGSSLETAVNLCFVLDGTHMLKISFHL